MEGSGISGELRMVRGIPLRVWPNRTDTSWAEEYSVRAAPPLDSVMLKPRRVPGPWVPVGRLFEDRMHLGKWLIRYERDVDGGLATRGEDEPCLSFDDSLGEMADRWRQSRDAANLNA